MVALVFVIMTDDKYLSCGQHTLSFSMDTNSPVCDENGMQVRYLRVKAAYYCPVHHDQSQAAVASPIEDKYASCGRHKPCILMDNILPNT